MAKACLKARPLLPTKIIKPRPPSAMLILNLKSTCASARQTDNMSFTFKSAFQSSFQTISGFSVPYVSRISGGLKAGKAIFIQGSVPSGCESFVVNLKCGESKENDIAFQIRTQFSSNCMVLNSRQHGAWGKRRNWTVLPLKQGSSFDLIIAVKF
ncbi:galectin-7-like [Cyprinus carpio]|uniref:Galectin n=1 Tax=Cyprinus carpio TaxID=7962 RepID=A0A9R0AHU3_CYPCA|nr:galectin-7-like [Cyprinus carpio]